MKNITKRLSLILALLMLMSVFTVAPITASAEISGDYEDAILKVSTAESASDSNLEATELTEQVEPVETEPAEKTTASALPVGMGTTYPLYLTGALYSTEPTQTLPTDALGYDYQILGDGTAEIKGYSGDKTDLEFPSEIDGHTVTSIGVDAFYACESLTSITIPSSVTSVGDYAFTGCRNLTSITIPDSITSIGIDAFSYTAWYDNLPDGVVYIGKLVYDYKGTCPETLVVKDGTIGICGEAFYDCTNLTNITIPDSVISIGSGAFYNTAWYNNQPDGVVYAGKLVYNYKGDCPETVTLKDDTIGICEYAFGDCTNLTNITMPNGVTIIGDSAFDYCTGLKSVTIPDSVISIGRAAFYYCTDLTSVTMSNGVTSIGDYAFYGCDNLKSVTIPSSVTNIGEYAFGYYDTELGSYQKIDGYKITGYSDTEAEKYAINNGFKFVSLGEVPTETEPQPTVTEPNECTHVNTTTTGEKSATYFEKGYTGDKVCADCGDVVGTGESIAVKKLKTPKVTVKGAKKSIKVTYKKVKDAKGFKVTYKIGKKTYNEKFTLSKKELKKAKVTKTIKVKKSGKYTVTVKAFTTSGKKIAYSKPTSANTVKVK